MSRRVNKHHINPTSRGFGGDDNNIVLLDEKFHEAFHYIFTNLIPEEQHKFLDEINVPGAYFDGKRLNSLRKKLRRASGKKGL